MIGLNEGAWFNNPDLDAVRSLTPEGLGLNITETTNDDGEEGFSWGFGTITDILQGIITVPALLYKFFSLDYPLWHSNTTLGIPLRFFTGIVGFFFIANVLYQIAPAMLNISGDILSGAAGLFKQVLPWR